MGIISKPKSHRDRTVPSSLGRQRRRLSRRTLRIESLEDRALLTGIPTIGLELQIDLREYDDDGTSQAVISGTVTGEETRTFDIEIDIDGDATADACVPTGEGARFTIDLGATLPFGEQTAQVRVRQWNEEVRDYLFSDWKSLTSNNESLASVPDASDDSSVDIALADILHHDDLYDDVREDADDAPLDEIMPPDGEFEGEPTPDPEIGPPPEELEIYAPVIVVFDAYEEEGDQWTFWGEVTYHDPLALTIYFDNGPLSGHSTDVDIDGSFFYSLQFVLTSELRISAVAVGNTQDIPDSEPEYVWIG